MESRAEGWRVLQAKRKGAGIGVGGDDVETADAGGARRQHPDGIGVPPDRRADREVVSPQHLRDLRRRDAVGHQRRETAIRRRLEIQRTQFDQSIERGVTRGAKIYAVGHGSCCDPCGGQVPATAATPNACRSVASGARMAAGAASAGPAVFADSCSF